MSSQSLATVLTLPLEAAVQAQDSIHASYLSKVSTVLQEQAAPGGLAPLLFADLRALHIQQLSIDLSVRRRDSEESGDLSCGRRRFECARYNS